MLLQEPHRPVPDTGYLTRLVVSLGALLALRLIGLHLAQIDLVRDEAQYWTWSRELAFGYFSKPPMIAWIIRGVTAICGNGEACIRSAAPVLYTVAALMIYFSGRELYGARIGFWSAIVFATLPGVALSSNLMTTDVPLLLLWTLMLYAWVMLVKRQSLPFALLLGIAIGLGLLAKQAMIYAALCITCHAMVSREARESLKGGRWLGVVFVALALFAPNVIWNAQHGFPMVRHTEANIGWQYPYVHPLRLLQYIGIQFGVFGPILLIVLARETWRKISKPADSDKALLLSFSLPVLVLLAIQALLSRAHGNWSATAYPAASILVTAVMFELNRAYLFTISLALHVAITVTMAAVPAFAREWPIFERLQFSARAMGWREAGVVVRAKLSEQPYGALLVDTRELAAEFLYYLRDVPVPLYVWKSQPSPMDHYEMTRPFTSASPEPVLFVSLDGCGTSVTNSFRSVATLGPARATLVKSKSRLLHFCRLAGYQGA
jgi:4-amino-4-deoxy-L-arabinose transferase-like glycosyltransferase